MPNPVRALVAVLTLALLLPSIGAADTWVIDPAHTVSGFTVRHMMITNVSGAFETTRGSIEFNPGDPAAIRADIAIETKSINTRNDRRDNHLRSDDFLNAEKFPSITFRSKRAQNVRPGGFELVGDLTIRDVTREVVLKVEGPTQPIRDPQGNRRVGANATTTINRKDFGVNWNRAIEAGGVVVGDEVKINIEVQAIEKKS
jgi:polyisoprenoid-binding protein YceI